RVTSSNGCTAVSNPPAVLSALSIPVATIRATQYPQVCAGSTLNLKAVSGNYTYQWFRDGVSLGAAVDSVLTAGTAGTYTVSLTNACGTSVSSGISLTVKSKPTAQITPGGALSFCTGDSVVLQANTGNAYTYSWWKGANALPGATSSAFMAKVAGNYKVNVTNKFGCSRTSAPVLVTVPCRTEETTADSDGLQVYPNPSSGDFTIRFTDLVLEERVQVQCMDMAGRELPFSIIQDSEHLMLQGLSPGICMLKITAGERVWVKRLIKL
ncbi:MAG: T9SS type A sorting domain-containing protein, partial [Bacteroidia bacterium]|nr:T9SS type A sorting domain-containing protein [Bacteroidia bacterium]